MAVTFTGAGVATATSGAGQAVTTATAFSASNILVVLVAYNNSGGGGADPMSGTISISPAAGAVGASVSAQTGLNDPSTVDSGLAVRCVAFPVTATIPTSTVVTLSWTGTVTVRAVALMKVSSSGGISYRTNSGATGGNTAGATAATALVTPSVTNGEGVLCWVGHENGAAVTGDADTSNGSWSAVYGTFQGSGATGMAAYFQSKVVTGTATQSFAPTGTSSDWITGALIFTETPATATPAVIATTAALPAATATGGTSGTAAPAAITTTVALPAATATGGTSGTALPAAIATAIALPAATASSGAATAIQEGFRWRNDDGSETGATWLAAQDTNTSVALATATRLRVVLDTTADIAATAYTLYYKKSTDSTWLPVPVGSGGPATLLTDDWTGTNGAAWNATKWPTQRDIAAGAGTITIQGNQGQLAGGGRPAAFSALSVTDFELLVKVSSASALAGRFPEIGWRIDPADVAASNPDGYCIQVTSSSGGKVDLFRINAYSLITTAPATELNAAVTAWFRILVVGTSHKVRWWLDGASEPSTWPIDATDATYTAGPLMLGCYSSAAVLFDDITVTDPAGSPNPVYVATSANITTSGEATTALLTAPSGKTTADFSVGRMWDDENGTDTVDI